MSYLSDLIKTLREEELQQFRLLDVIGKEELVRDTYIAFARTKLFKEEKLPEKLGLSQSHFDQINSVLLAKTIQKLWGNDFSKIFFNIQNKGLINLLFHQLKIYEKQLLKSGNFEQITVFYKSAFDILRAMYHPGYSSKLTQEFGKKYLQSLGEKKRLEDDVYIRMLTWCGDITEARAKASEKELLPKAEKELSRWRKKVLAANNPVANCFLGIAEATYWKCFEDPQKYIEAYNFALKGFYEANGGVEKKWEGVLLSETAFGYLSLNQAAKALELYDRVMVAFPDTVGAHIYHQYTYFSAAVIAKDFTKSRQIFDEKFRVRILPDTLPQILFEVYALGFLQALHERNMNDASDWFGKIITVVLPKTNPISKMMLRIYETMYFYFSGDMETALRLSEKHLNYIRHLPDGKERYGLIFRPIDCINKFIRYRKGEKKLMKKAEKAVNALYDGLNNLYSAPVREEWESLNAAV